MSGHRWTGLAAIALAVAFNIPYAVLAATYSYPAVLRGPSGAALDLFAAGGPTLVLTWEMFMLAALAMTPLAVALSVTPQRLAARPALALGAAMAGGLAGLAQAIGLSRWVFAVPALARDHAEAGKAIAAERAFDLLNAWGGVAIGEHLGQLLTALFALQLAALQRHEGQRVSAALGFLTALLIFVGAGEGPALALGGTGEAFGLAATAGFLALTLWLIATGVALIRAAPRAA